MSNQPADSVVVPDGQLFDLGYRHYEGRRKGRTHAIWALTRYSMKRGLGVKKRWTAKIIPILLYAAAFLPVIIVIGVGAILGPVEGFDYPGLFEGLSVVLLIFAAATAPEMLCDDRREGVLPLYFSRVITRGDYLIAKIAALAILMGTIALAPALMLFTGNTFLAESPLRYLADNVADVGRIVAAGVLISVFYAALGLVVAAFMERKGVAAAIYVGGILVGTGIIASIFESVTGSWRRYLALTDPRIVPQGINNWIFNTTPAPDSIVGGAALPGPAYLLSVFLVVALCAGVMYRRYLTED